MSEATTGVPAAKASVSTMPKLSPPSDGAHRTSASASTASFSSSLHLPCATTSRGSSMSGARPSSSTPTTCSVAGMCSRSASKARSRTGRPLRSTAWPMKAIRSGSSGVAGCARARRRRRRRRHVDPVGDDPVRPAEEAPPGPGGGLRDGDPHVQAVQPPARAEEVRQVVGEDVLRVAVERRDERRVDGHQRVPAGDRRDRLVQVHDVVAALELAAQRDDGRDAVGDVRDRAVGREADRAPQRHEVVGQRALRRARSAVQAQRETVVRIDRRQDADLVPGSEVLLGERLDVARHSPRVRPRIRRHQRDPHRWHPIPATPRSPKARM